jgi:hypothetical protein
MNAVKLLFDLYDAVRNVEQVEDEGWGIPGRPYESFDSYRDALLRAKTGLRAAADAAAAFIDASDRVFSEACKRSVIQAQTSLAVNVPEVQPCYQGPVTCSHCGRLASCYVETGVFNLCMKCHNVQQNRINEEGLTYGG